MIRRTVDIFVSALALVLMAPVLVLVSIAVALESSGGVLFAHERMGRGFRPFRLYKFRTMSASVGGPQITMAGDPRVTRVGAWLRKTKLDEVPQFINVLKGDMTLIGPRPEVREYVDMFRADYEDILKVRPGITDLASVAYSDEAVILARAVTPMDYYVQTVLPRKLKLSKEGIARSSFAFDMSLLLRTLGGILGDLVDVIAERRRRIRRSLGQSAWFERVLRYRRPFIVGLHGVMSAVASFAALWLRFDGAIPADVLGFWLKAFPVVVVVRLIWCIPFRLFEGLWRYTSLWDLRNIMLSVTLGSVSLFAFIHGVAGFHAYPRAAYVIEAMLLIFIMGGVRLMYRIAMEFSRERPGRRVLVYGAGDAGEFLVRELKTPGRAVDVQVIGFIDDDRVKVGSRIHGVRVLGTRIDIPQIIKESYPDEVVVAIGDATPAAYREIVSLFEAFKIDIKNMRESSSAAGQSKLTMSAISLDDLVLRGAAGDDRTHLMKAISHQNVMVVGAGRLVGAEIARQLLDLSPSVLMLFDGDEEGLFRIAEQLRARGIADCQIVTALGQSSHAGDVAEAFRRSSPAVVFDAGGYQRAALAEENAVGTLTSAIVRARNLIDAAERYSVSRYVHVSTGHAMTPESVLGAARRITELLLRRAAVDGNTTYATVRLGTVVTERDGIVAAIVDQIHAGGPVTISDPDTRRSLMLLPDAARAVLEVAARMARGATYVPRVAESVRMLDLVRNLVRLSGDGVEDVQIDFSGLAHGERREEELVAPGETLLDDSGEPVLRVDVPESCEEAIWALSDEIQGSPDRVCEQLVATLRDGWALNGEHVGAPVEGQQELVPASPREQVCPSCKGDVHRSRARNMRERMQKGLTERRLYRCDVCSWRGWLLPQQFPTDCLVKPASAPDLGSLDKKLPVGSPPEKTFSPRKLA